MKCIFRLFVYIDEELRHMKGAAKRRVKREQIFFRFSALGFYPVRVENHFAEFFYAYNFVRNENVDRITVFAQKSFRFNRFRVKYFDVNSVFIQNFRKENLSVRRDLEFEIFMSVSARADKNLSDVAFINRRVIFVIR